MKKFKPKTRKTERKEVWRNTCKSCKKSGWTHYIPDEYELCNHCFLAHFGLDGEHDTCDQLGMGDLLYKESDVLRVLRTMVDGVYVHH